MSFLSLYNFLASFFASSIKRSTRIDDFFYPIRFYIRYSRSFNYYILCILLTDYASISLASITSSLSKLCFFIYTALLCINYLFTYWMFLAHFFMCPIKLFSYLRLAGKNCRFFILINCSYYFRANSSQEIELSILGEFCTKLESGLGFSILILGRNYLGATIC